MPSHQFSLNVNTGIDNFSLVQSVTNSQSKSLDIALAASTTNHEEDMVLTRAQIKSILLKVTGGDLTIKTNSTGSPGDTVVMAAGAELFWCPTDTNILAFGADPFPTADVTKLYLSSTAGCTFQLRAIVTNTNG